MAMCFASTALVACSDAPDDTDPTTAGGTAGSGPTGGNMPTGVPGSCSKTPWVFGLEGADLPATMSGLAVDQDCSFVIAGYFDHGLELGGEPLVGDGDDMFLARYEESGVLRWSKSFVSEVHSTPSVALDRAGNIFLSGMTYEPLDLGCGPTEPAASTIYLAKLDPDGACLWNTTFIGDVGAGGPLAVDGAGNAFVAGWFASDFDVGTGPLHSGNQTGFVVEVDPSGQRIWSRVFEGAGVTPAALTTDPAGNIVVTGLFAEHVDLGGTPLAGYGEAFDPFVAKLDPAGNHLWSRAFPGTESPEGMLAVASEAQVVLAGRFDGTIGVGFGPEPNGKDADFLVALDADDGEPLWRHGFGRSHSAALGGLALDPEGVLVSGTFTGELDLGGEVLESGDTYGDAFLMAYDPGGELRTHRVYRGAPQGGVFAGHLEVDLSGNVLMAAALHGTATLLGEELTSGELANYLVMRVDLTDRAH